MDFEDFTYGGGEFLRLVFNGIAAIVGTGDYVTALKLAAIIGLIWVLVEGAFRQRPLNLQWLLGVILVYLAFMVPKANVIITDRIDATQSGVVANVPIGLAATARTFSLLGDWLTRSYETVFSLPDDLRYHQSGMLFATYLVEASTRFEITDQRALRLAPFGDVHKCRRGAGHHASPTSSETNARKSSGCSGTVPPARAYSCISSDAPEYAKARIVTAPHDIPISSRSLSARSMLSSHSRVAAIIA